MGDARKKREIAVGRPNLSGGGDVPEGGAGLVYLIIARCAKDERLKGEWFDVEKRSSMAPRKSFRLYFASARR